MDKTFYLISKIEKDEVMLKAKKKYITHSMLQCIVSLITLIAFDAVFWKFRVSTRLIAMGVESAFTVIAVFIIGVTVLNFNIHMRRLKRWLKNMPNTVRITDAGITIDSKAYACEEIKQIKVTPSEYEWKNLNTKKSDRELTIIDKRNEKSQYFLGVRVLSGFFAKTFIAPMLFEKIMFRNYEELCDTLRQVFINKGQVEKFIFDLEDF